MYNAISHPKFSAGAALMKTATRFVMISALGLVCAGIISAMASPPGSVDDWPSYGHDPGGMRYSPLTQINRENVSQLKVAWVFHTGDISDGSQGRRRSGFETTPIFVDGILYLTTHFNRVIALDRVGFHRRDF
jgi:quinoprotein glucose dehydrogenase